MLKKHVLFAITEKKEKILANCEISKSSTNYFKNKNY